VHVTERITDKAVVYVVRDEGNGFDVSSVPDPTNSQNLLRASGRGLMLIRTFMDEVLFNDTGNEIIMVKRRNGH
jgi:anti-sigma regulatory factor (Ser/Thr protein kinase)